MNIRHLKLTNVSEFDLSILVFYTSPVTAKQSEAKWEKTRVRNLVRYVPSGTYYARIRVGGKLVWRSLETDTFSVAKIKLRDVEHEEQAKLESADRLLDRDATFGDALALFEKNLESNMKLKPGAKLYRRKTITALLKSWPSLKATRLAKITEADCKEWAKNFDAEYSPSVYNNTLATLQMVIDLGVSSGIRYKNPASGIGRAKPTERKLALPSHEQFLQFVNAVAVGGGRFSHDCADLVQFLAYGGFRKTEAANVTWHDVDFEKGQIHLRVTKNGETRHVPMIPDMRDLLQRRRAARPAALNSEHVTVVHECQKAMDRAAKVVGMARITHHDLRHLFATRCIESGVDIPTVSRWLGHKDGGALAMKVYGHLRDAHSSAMAQKVTFSVPKAEPAVEGRAEPTTVEKPSAAKVRALKARKGASPAPGTHRLAAENRPAP